MPKNGTSGTETKNQRPPFNANIPPKWRIEYLFYASSTFGWVYSQFFKIAHFLFFELFFLLHGQTTKSAKWHPKKCSRQKANKPALKQNFLSKYTRAGLIFRFFGFWGISQRALLQTWLICGWFYIYLMLYCCFLQVCTSNSGIFSHICLQRLLSIPRCLWCCV